MIKFSKYQEAFLRAGPSSSLQIVAKVSDHCMFWVVSKSLHWFEFILNDLVVNKKLQWADLRLKLSSVNRTSVRTCDRFLGLGRFVF